jgi:hypothetical protein
MKGYSSARNRDPLRLCHFFDCFCRILPNSHKLFLYFDVNFLGGLHNFLHLPVLPNSTQARFG